MFRQIGPTEILIILGVIVLLFGGRKLPEVARGSGRALRIFKSEIKGMHEDDEDSEQDSAQSSNVNESIEASQPDPDTPTNTTNESKRDKG